MQTKITELIKRFEALRKDLEKEYSRLMTNYGYSVEKRKIIFLEEFARKNKLFREGFFRMFSHALIRNILSAPFIYMMIFPAIILDIFLSIYQYIAFSLWYIPYVKRSDHFIYERRFLDYLNWFQKLNCLYCSYVNGLFSYAVEIGACTERYWCPLKATQHPKLPHNWYNDFADYGNPEEWVVKYHENNQAFCKIREE
ncbi:MAG: hypothetical protein WC774_04325 [Candidatus Gracilibacteria bacterium]|jgi:hypothetical protein